jgi:serine/threonine protein kinase
MSAIASALPRSDDGIELECLGRRARYQFREEFDRTRCSVVSYGRDLRESKIVVVKRAPSYSAIRELRMHEMVEDCEYVVKYLDVFKRDDYTSIVMEHGGKTLLDQFIKPTSDIKRDIAFDELKEITRQLLISLLFFRERRLFHGDLKSDNVLFDEKTRRIKIIDFHMSEIASTFNHSKKQALDVRSPFLILGENYDSRDDVWSAACIIYELFVKKYPFCFWAGARDEASKEATLLQSIAAKRGMFPAEMIEKSRFRDKFFKKDESSGRYIFRSENRALYCDDKDMYTNILAEASTRGDSRSEASQLADLLFKMFSYSRRPSLEELLEHPFLTS